MVEFRRVCGEIELVGLLSLRLLLNLKHLSFVDFSSTPLFHVVFICFSISSFLLCNNGLHPICLPCGNLLICDSFFGVFFFLLAEAKRKGMTAKIGDKTTRLTIT